jgi:hypothetical protein
VDFVPRPRERPGAENAAQKPPAEALQLPQASQDVRESCGTSVSKFRMRRAVGTGGWGALDVHTTKSEQKIARKDRLKKQFSPKQIDVSSIKQLFSPAETDAMRFYGNFVSNSKRMHTPVW